MTGAHAHVVEAELELRAGLDPAAVGAAVTTELCGHWEHDGACRWPHNNDIDAAREPTLFRTLFIADEADEVDVRERIASALRDADGWRLLAIRERPVTRSERALAQRLLRSPRAPA